jgi:ABC-2 type transport system permease protein
MLPISLAIVGISAGSSAVGREENSGTLELLLSSPISRSRLMIEKLTAVTLQLFIIAFAVWVTIALSKYFLNYDINLQDAALATLSAFLVGLVFACSAVAIQAISGSRSLAIGICFGILIVAYFVDSLAPLVDVMDSIKHASVFHYYDGQEALLGDGNVINSVILFAASLILAALAVFSFDKRDIGI